MILYPPAKVNLGLHVLFKRPDNYHELETLMAETPFCDVLEINPSTQDSYLQTGLPIPMKDETDNLCLKALALLRTLTSVPPVAIHLRKQIPIGAGLGGGSSDAAYLLKGLNKLFQLGISTSELIRLAALLGSDCAFFIEGGIQLATGRGEKLSPVVQLKLAPWLVLCNPQIHVSTAQAYANISVNSKREKLLQLVKNEGVQSLTNDFEASVFTQYPQIADLKKQLVNSGASYAAMSGSGSSVFALFSQAPDLKAIQQEYILYNGPWNLH
ncbi:MAG: 4-diphosphocytidyl-2-C-methyl-D-erythritol kinase [Bacteroidota bacterium]|jgi:4-diphosphocytidyl-2-C-methyl-D-erythritol kinase